MKVKLNIITNASQGSLALLAYNLNDFNNTS